MMRKWENESVVGLNNDLSNISQTGIQQLKKFKIYIFLIDLLFLTMINLGT